jgi:hypothetical protein
MEGSSSSTTNRSSSGSYHDALGGFPNIGGRFITPPEKFGGHGQKQAERWLVKIKDIIRIYNIQDLRTIISIAGSHLEDDALDWWYNIEAEVKSWQQFEDMFKKKYMKNIMENAWKELKSMQQKDDEDIEEFATRLKGVVKKIGTMKDDQMRSIFIASINGAIEFEMEKEVSRNSTITYDALLDKAMEYEYLMKKYNIDRVNRSFDSDEQKSPKKAVTFKDNIINSDAKDKEMVNDSKFNGVQVDEVTSVGTSNSSLNSILSELVHEMRALKIHNVEQSEIISQQQKIINQQYQTSYQNSYHQGQQSRGYYGQNGNMNGGRPPLYCYNCREEGHMRRDCPHYNSYGNTGNNTSYVSNNGSNAGNVGNNNGNARMQNGSGITAAFNNTTTDTNTNVNNNSVNSSSGKDSGHL